MFGATGRVGSAVVAKLLAGGDQPVAFVRDPSRLKAADPRLAVVVGDVPDGRSIRMTTARFFLESADAWSA